MLKRNLSSVLLTFRLNVLTISLVVLGAVSGEFCGFKVTQEWGASFFLCFLPTFVYYFPGDFGHEFFIFVICIFLLK